MIEFLAGGGPKQDSGAEGRKCTEVEADWRRDSHFAVVREAAHQSPAGPRRTTHDAHFCALLQLAEEIINGRFWVERGQPPGGSRSLLALALLALLLREG